VRAPGVEGTPPSISRKDKTMTTLMQASRQWATRPADERYASLLDMQNTMTGAGSAPGQLSKAHVL
jgi:hypothetical protein